VERYETKKYNRIENRMGGGMNMKRRRLIILLFFLMAFLGCKTLSLSAEAPRMTTEELKGILGNADLVVIDVRLGKGWTESDIKIKGAVREDPENVGSWANHYGKDKTLILYCS
jgi:hypothetical protein